ncbi:hypothetical protein NC653_035609 [Populus alba x Populus x berolinensis]|uniref:Uncharacterized protein n=1 Tax=Populus alba x Populus x berolinensis TaxID=444605 RepID=A0AAD6LI89_9ROSI|nr:hypothetical protein NC653_035609 [Populus alba x Populus x berolinensis]
MVEETWMAITSSHLSAVLSFAQKTDLFFWGSLKNAKEMIFVVAITVFCLLVIAFYAFLAPFLGGKIWEYVLIGTYTPVVLLVFILYVRSTAINPADPGIYCNAFVFFFTSRKFYKLQQTLVRKGQWEKLMRAETAGQPPSRKSSHNIGLIFCALFVYEDCRKQEGIAEQTEQW